MDKVQALRRWTRAALDEAAIESMWRLGGRDALENVLGILYESKAL